MTIKDLVPKFTRGRERSLARRREFDPFRDFRQEANRLFDDFFSDFGLAPMGGFSEHATDVTSFSPRVDVSETDGEVKVLAELPGMDEKDITVEMDDEAVTIRGQKKSESEEEGERWYRREQSYGAFHRVLPLPAAVEGAKAKATFKKGLLTITAPKRAGEEPKRKTITIETD